MSNIDESNLNRDVAGLLCDTGKAHHEAYSGSDGADEEWPIWHADYLQYPLAQLLSTRFTQDQLVYCLMTVEHERMAMGEEVDWPAFYATYFLSHFATEEEPVSDKLALYYTPGCPFCQLVLRSIERLNVEVELRNTAKVQQHLKDLITARSRATVPVLRITPKEGNDRWMPESRDIVSFLEKTYERR